MNSNQRFTYVCRQTKRQQFFQHVSNFLLQLFVELFQSRTQTYLHTSDDIKQLITTGWLKSVCDFATQKILYMYKQVLG
jgi:hypothetical protein